MRRVVGLGLCMLLVGCGPASQQSYLQSEARFLRMGVDLEQEERAVRRVLAQRRLLVVSEVRGPGFVALGAAKLDHSESSVRIITQRGVVVAEDAAFDHLFAPAQLSLIEELNPSMGEYVLIAATRTPKGLDRGCVALFRVLDDGSAVQAVLDVSAFGSRACVADLRRAGGGRMRALIAFPGLFALHTPVLEAEIAFQRVLLGEATPMIPVARVVGDGDWLEPERARLAELPVASADFSQRHALGVARAALAHVAGQATAEQLSLYRTAIDRVLPGSPEAEIVADTVGHIEHGWLDASEATSPDGAPAPGPPEAPGLDEESTVIDPAAVPEATKPDLHIEPDGMAPQPDELEPGPPATEPPE